MLKDGRSTDEIIAEMTRRIVEQFDPLQVILFGSHARGDARADSDVDLLVGHLPPSSSFAMAIHAASDPLAQMRPVYGDQLAVPVLGLPTLAALWRFAPA